MPFPNPFLNSIPSKQGGSSNNNQLNIVSDPIDLTAIGVKDIGINGNAILSLSRIKIFINEISGLAPSSFPVVSIGTNNPNYDNIYAALPFDLFTTDTENMGQDVDVSNGPGIASGAEIKANVTVASDADTYSANISLSGVVQ